MKCVQYIDPYDADAHFLRGNALRDNNRNDEALASYNKAIELDPNHILALKNRKELLNKK